MPKKPIPVYLPKELILQLEEKAREQSRSRNGMIEFILKKYFEPTGNN